MPPHTTLSNDEIKSKIRSCPRLASLRSINMALGELVNAEQSYTSQIADIIRRDPTLTTRLLKLVNSVFFGLSQRVTNIEDAVFYLGLKQIRELALATPIIEDFESLKKTNNKVNWRHLWQHSIGVAMITRDLVSMAKVPVEGESDYIAGLVHNVGKVIMASVFPDIFNALLDKKASTSEVLCAFEREALGWDHAQVGAFYLQKHQLPAEVVEAVEFHHTPVGAPHVGRLCAAIQVADYMVRSVGLQTIEQIDPIEGDVWRKLPAWSMLFDSEECLESHEMMLLNEKLKQLPSLIHEMV